MGRNCKELDYQRAELADIERGKREMYVRTKTRSEDKRGGIITTTPERTEDSSTSFSNENHSLNTKL